MATAVPRNVSPVLRAGKWIAVISGFFYAKHRIETQTKVHEELLKFETPIKKRMALVKKYKQDVSDTNFLNEFAVIVEIDRKLDPPPKPDLENLD